MYSSLVAKSRICLYPITFLNKIKFQRAKSLKMKVFRLMVYILRKRDYSAEHKSKGAFSGAVITDDDRISGKGAFFV